MNISPRALSSTLRIWLPLAAVTTAIIGGMYFSFQQAYRQTANDPQIEVTAEAKTLLANGSTPQALVPTTTVDLRSDYGTFVMMYDEAGNLLASNAVLDNAKPVVPKGVITWTAAHGEDRVTWQPKTGVRLAIVARRGPATGNTIIVAGRSLRETERRIDAMGANMEILYFVTLAGSLILVLGLAMVRDRARS